jgi:pyridoxal phosphate enzyme (YggS family)
MRLRTPTTCLAALLLDSSAAFSFSSSSSSRRALTTPAFAGRMDPTTSVHSVTSQASRASAVAGASSAILRAASTSADADADAAEIDVAANLADVQSKIEAKVDECHRPKGSVRLVAVSKTKPLNLLRDAYQAGQRAFGENYAQELMAKAADMPPDVAWHFIGPLQSNKAAQLVRRVGLPQLACVETVASKKLAAKLNNAVDGLEEEDGEEGQRLGIYLQVNTSGESSKSGLAPGSELIDLATDIAATCPRLSIDGLMTIGAPGDLSCFDALVRCREEVAQALGVDVDSLDLSMGMSGDYEHAIERGATSVRVGSTIFGARDYSNLNKK